MSYSSLAKECFRSLQDKRATHLGHYQIDLEKLSTILEKAKDASEPKPDFDEYWEKKRSQLLREVETFWTEERERAFIAGLEIKEKRSKSRFSRKRKRPEEDDSNPLGSYKRRRLSPSLLELLQPPCIHRDYRSHEPGPLFPQAVEMVSESDDSDSGSDDGAVDDGLGQGTLEDLRSARRWKYLHEKNAKQFWVERIRDLCDNPRAASVSRIRAEISKTRGKIRRPLPYVPSPLKWQTDNLIFTEIKRKQRRRNYLTVPEELVEDPAIPVIRRIHSTAQVELHGGTRLPWIQLDERSEQRLEALQTWLVDCNWPSTRMLDRYTEDETSGKVIERYMDQIDRVQTNTEEVPGADIPPTSSAKSSFKSTCSTDSATDWITKTSRAEVNLKEAMRYCQRRVEVAEAFVAECTGYLQARVHNERAFNQDLLASVEVFLGFC